MREYDELLAETEQLLRAVGDRATGVPLEEVRVERRRWTEELPQVALVSGFSAGKTTLVKHWFGLPELPVGHKATTAAPTRIEYGNPDRVRLLYRQVAKVSLRTSPTHVDHAAAAALVTWAEAPDDFHIDEFTSADGTVLTPESLTELIADARRAPREAIPAVVVHFKERPVEDFSLSLMPAGWFAGRLVEPSSSLALSEVVCHSEHRLLRRVSVLDTPGYGAAAGHHQETSAGVVRRRPEVTVVLLDSRRLDEPRSRRVLADVWQQVRTAGDADAVLVGLTWWQSLLSATARDRDAAPGTEHDKEFHSAILQEKQEELALLLHDVSAMPASLAIPLELGPRPSRAVARNPELLLESASKRARGRPRPSRGESTAALVGQATELIRVAADTAAEEQEEARRRYDRIADRARNAKLAGPAMTAAVNRAADTINSTFRAEEAAVLADVDTARSRKEIMGFLPDKYPGIRSESIGRLRRMTVAQTTTLQPYLGDGLPEVIYPPSRSSEEQTRRIGRLLEVVDTAGYWGTRLIDVLLPTRISEEAHEEARSLLRGFAENDMVEVKGAIGDWWRFYITRHDECLVKLTRKAAKAEREAFEADQALQVAIQEAARLAAILDQSLTLDEEAQDAVTPAPCRRRGFWWRGDR